MVSVFVAAIQPVFDALTATNVSPTLVFVDDGSSDNTSDEVGKLASLNDHIRLIELSRNFGKEAALSAGIDYAVGQKFDGIILIDVDLQDPVEEIPNMVEAWEEGADVVLMQRVDRSEDTIFKRNSAKLYYRLFNALSEHKIVENVGDYRLIDKKVARELTKLEERNRVMKSLIPWVGFETKILPYKRKSRHAGKTSFNVIGLSNLAINSITSHSTTLLRLWGLMGILMFLASLAFAVKIIFEKMIFGIEVPGYASLVVITTLIGGVNMLGLAVIGEYVGRIYLESKRRPLYVIKSIS
jgi:Glycosyltransferases involved in cell wall biogenesis